MTVSFNCAHQTFALAHAQNLQGVMGFVTGEDDGFVFALGWWQIEAMHFLKSK
jgi:hypothetical protein